MDVSTCPGPQGLPIPLLHFDDEQPTGAKLAVSMADGRAVISAAATPFEMLTATSIMLSPDDRKCLGQLLLTDDADMAQALTQAATQ